MTLKLKRILVGMMALGGFAFLIVPNAVSAHASKSHRAPKHASKHAPRATVARYQHVVEIMMENTSYGTIIGNPAAPNINALANHYGLATDYFGVTHPSEPNYIASIGGSFFGIQDDNQFYCTPAMASTDPNCAGTTVNHTVNDTSLADQLTAAGKSWKGYFQSLPYVDPSHIVKTGPNANGPYTFKWPSNTDALYASKHNPFINFAGTQNALSQMVPDNQLGLDLLTGKLPTYGLVVPDQCHDMHGTGGCSDTTGLIQTGDQYVRTTVDEIMASRTWKKGNNAIVITWDEDDYSDQGQPGTGCCGTDVGGGHIVTIVITNHEAAHRVDPTPYNHYALLRTLEQAFGLPCLRGACSREVPTMAPLFANHH